MTSQQTVPMAIVGGGASAVLLLAAMEKPLKISRSLFDIHIFDSNGKFGRGYAYSCKSDVYRLNTSSATMSVDECNANDFIEWMGNRSTGLGEIPRRLYGDYLEARLYELIHRIHALGHHVELHADPVKRILCGNTYKVETERVELVANHCIIATGGRPILPTKIICHHRRIILAADEEGLQQIPRGSAVGVLGASQSAIDACLFLDRHKLTSQCSLISRSGVLPRVKSELRLPTVQLSADQFATAADVKEHALRRIHWRPKSYQWPIARSFRSMEMDLKRSLRAQPSWQSVMCELTPIINRVWAKTDPSARNNFLADDYQIMRHLRSGIPPTTAAKFLSLRQRDATLELLRGEYKLRCENGNFEYLGQDRKIRNFDFLINASGFDAKSFHELLADDLAKGTITINPFGGLNVDPQSMCVLDNTRQPIPGLYAIGYPSFGNVLIVNSIEVVRQCAIALARHIVYSTELSSDTVTT